MSRVRLLGDGELSAGLRSLGEAAGATFVDEDADLTVLTWSPTELRAKVAQAGLGPGDRVLVATRGLEPATGLRLTQVVCEETAVLRVGTLCGPVIPGEIRRRSPCAALVASPYRQVGEAAGAAFRSPLCQVYTSHDLPGAELAGALVEIFAVAVGISYGLGLGVGASALLISRAIVEGGRLAAREGGEMRTFAGLAGVGDLVASAGSTEHLGHRRGLALVRGETDAELAAHAQALLQREPRLPITSAVAHLAAGRSNAAEELARLMTREHHGEWE